MYEMVEAVMAFPECPGGRDDYPVRHARRTWQAHGSLLSWALDELFKPGLQIKPVRCSLRVCSGASRQKGSGCREGGRGCRCAGRHSGADQRSQQEPATPPHGRQAARRSSCNLIQILALLQ